jgi:hypothetical protein
MPKSKPRLPEDTDMNREMLIEQILLEIFGGTARLKRTERSANPPVPKDPAYRKQLVRVLRQARQTKPKLSDKVSRLVDRVKGDYR